MKHFILSCAALFLLIPFSMISQEVQWGKSEPYAGHVVFTSCTTQDNKGNVVVAGQIDMQGGAYLIKYSNTGVKVWEKYYQGYRGVEQLTTDNAGNIYFTLWQNESSSTHIEGQVFKGITTLKYNPEGMLQWGGPWMLLANSFNSDNTVFITSYFKDSILLKGNILLTTNKPEGARFIGKMDSDGNFKWATIQETGICTNLYRSNDTNFFVKGYFTNSVTLGEGIHQVTLSSQNGSSNYQAKYSNTGILLWAKQLKSNLWTVDAESNLYAWEQNQVGDKKLFLKKFNSNGIQLWKRTSMELGDWYKGQMTYDKSGNSFISGGYLNFVTIGDATIYGPSDRYQFFVAKFDSSGSLKWITTSSGSGGAGSKAISVDDENNIYITGDMGGEVNFGGFMLNEVNGGIFTLKIKDLDVSPVNIKKTEAHNKSDIAIYPNPSGGIITIKSISAPSTLRQAQGDGELRLENVLGQLVYSKKLNTNGSGIDESVDLSKYPKGVYFVQVNTGSGVEVRKIVLE